MNKEVGWWEYTREYMYGSRENVFTKKTLINFFFENGVIRRKEQELLDKNLKIILGPCIVITKSTIKIGFYVSEKE